MLLNNPHGQFLKKLVDVNGYPYYVALYNDRYMAVRGIRKLRIYKL